jgi:hypothetical protein
VAVGRWLMAGGHWPLAGGRWPLAGGRWPLAVSRGLVANTQWLWPMGYDYEFSRSLNGRSGTAGNGKKILFYVSCYGEDCT